MLSGFPIAPSGNPVVMSSDKNTDESDGQASGRDKSTETEPTESGHSTADTQADRNSEDESPS
jgi:hypothetical protein